MAALHKTFPDPADWVEMKISAASKIVPYEQLTEKVDPSSEQVAQMVISEHVNEIPLSKNIPLVCSSHQTNFQLLRKFGEDPTISLDQTRVVGYVPHLRYHVFQTGFDFLGGIARVALPQLRKIYGDIPFNGKHEDFLYEVSMTHDIMEDGALFPHDISILKYENGRRFYSCMCPLDMSLELAARELKKTITKNYDIMNRFHN